MILQKFQVSKSLSIFLQYKFSIYSLKAYEKQNQTHVVIDNKKIN